MRKPKLYWFFSAVVVANGLWLMGCGARFTTDVRALGVPASSLQAMDVTVGSLGFTQVGSRETGLFLLSNQPAVASALKEKDANSKDLDLLLFDVLRNSGFFRDVLAPPYSPYADDVDVEVEANLRALDYSDTYGGWWLMGLVSLGITDLIGIPYKSKVNAEVELVAKDRNGEKVLVSSGRGYGEKKTNWYQLMFSLAEVPHAMDAVNQALTKAVYGAVSEMAGSRAKLQEAAALPAPIRPRVEPDAQRFETPTVEATILVPIEFDAGFGVKFDVGIAIDDGEVEIFKGGSRVIRELSVARHTVRLTDPERGIFHAPNWEDFEMVLDLTSVSDPSVVIEGRNHMLWFSLHVKILTGDTTVAEHHIDLN